ETKTLRLPQDRVFEDTEPRLADVDLDGDNEVIVVESSQSQGARLAIYDENGLVAATHYIGQRNRWLAPVGAGDMDGDGFVEIAYVDRPHLAKTLRVWRFEAGHLTQVGELAGVTNHRIGEDFISGGLRDCDGTPEMIVMSANWSKVIAATFKNAQISTQEIGPYSGYQSAIDALACE
ncbi:VCBS repeat-containing protein, partial [Planktotalea sp.]|uniref:FG-GAP repeat domain-containing protein n=1 Tax=Planktotalea sp. TaxID=2029877 RepID=UPI00329A0A36